MEQTERVYNVFKQILDQQAALFFNRHIDQLILCSLYGVAKVSLIHANEVLITSFEFSLLTIALLTGFSVNADVQGDCQQLQKGAAMYTRCF